MDLLPYPVKRAVHLGARAYRRLTSPARVLPSFLICGGQRCGAIWLYRALAAHPAVLTPAPYPGIHYFDNAYHRGVGWYRAHFPARRAARGIRVEYGVPAQAGSGNLLVGVRPHDLVVGQTPDDAALALQGKVVAVEPLGAETLVHLDVQGGSAIATAPGKLVPEVESAITAWAAPGSLYLFDAESEKALGRL